MTEVLLQYDVHLAMDEDYEINTNILNLIKETVQCVFSDYNWSYTDVNLKSVQGEILFAKQIEHPVHWTHDSVRITGSKYFSPTETSIKQMINRVVSFISYHGWREKYFQNEQELHKFVSELTNIVISQRATFNSPVWFNLGKHEFAQGSACYINSIEDNLDSISELGVIETKLFSRGSGSGTNYSKLRAKGEKLSRGGSSSGAVSFMAGHDAMGGTIKSGGTCLAPHQKVVTTNGIFPVVDLINKKFNVLSYDKAVGRVMVKPAIAFATGKKLIYQLKTDKGIYHLTGDHPILMADGNYKQLIDLRKNMSIMPLTIDIVSDDKYYRVGLRDGKKGRMRLHQLVAIDIMKYDITDKIIHHIDHNGFNNNPSNLQVMTQSEHAKNHNMELVNNNNHIFQLKKFGKDGKDNPMHSSSNFWKDKQKVAQFKLKKIKQINNQNPKKMQVQSTKIRMMNLGYQLINDGYDIKTFDKYISARKVVRGRIGSIKRTLQSFVDLFGSYNLFYRELRVNNQKVISIEPVSEMVVYDVEVDCNSINEPIYESNHNFAIVSQNGNMTSPMIFVHNTRRSARMVILDVDHPDIEEFIESKVLEEDKMRILAKAGVDVGMDSNARMYSAFQNGNHSVRAIEGFMEAVKNGDEWELKGRIDKSVNKIISARQLLKDISRASHQTGDPALQFSNTINKWHTAPHEGEIVASNPCVVGKTKILMENGGWKRIDSLLYENSTIITNYDEIKSAKIKESFHTGFKSVYKLTTKAGYELLLTANHKVWTINRGFVEAINLIKQDKIKILDRIVSELHPSDNPTFYIMLGAYLGDGHGENGSGVIYTVGQQNRVMIDTFQQFISDHSYLSQQLRSPQIQIRNETTLVLQIKAKKQVAMFAKYLDLTQKSYEKTISDEIFELPLGDQKYVLQGLFSTDGTVGNYGDKSQYVALDSSSHQLLKDVQIMLLGFGIKSKLYTGRRGKETNKMLPNGKGGMKKYNVKPMFSLRISRSGRKLFESLIGFYPNSLKQHKLVEMNKTFSTYQDKATDKVKSVEFVGEREVFDLTEPVSNTFVANGITVHNCAEYLFLNETACNLASIKLTTFLSTDGEFDHDSFDETIITMITAMDIIVGSAIYPTEKIAYNTKRHRTLGLGFTDLGGFMIAKGYPYDSPQARAWATVLTGLLTGIAYTQSMILASQLGACDGYHPDHMQYIIEMHNKEVNRLIYGNHEMFTEEMLRSKVPVELIQLLETTWDSLSNNGHIPMRNNQLTVQAPAGTISFMLDASTFGIEPDFALKKYKQLVGGGHMETTNPMVMMGLEVNGFSLEDIGTIGKCIDKNLPLPKKLREDPRIQVLACASKQFDNSLNSIDIDGHLLMMASIQPLISGGISKTVNLPEKTTEDEIYDLYIRAYDLGLKSVAVYRDNSKVTQALSTTSFEKVIKEEIVADRQKMPSKSPATRFTVKVNGATCHIILGYYPKGHLREYQLGEVFLNMGKQGTTVNGLLESIGRITSIALQHGIPIEELAHQFEGMNFSPQGFVQGVDSMKMANSILDLLSVVITEEQILGGINDDIIELEDHSRINVMYIQDSGSGMSKNNLNSVNLDSVYPTQFSGKTCQLCGSSDLQKTGNNCYTCGNCGDNSECG